MITVTLSCLFLLIPALSSLISFFHAVLGGFRVLRFVPSGMFFVGLVLVTISLLMLCLASRRKSQLSKSLFGGILQNDDISLPLPTVGGSFSLTIALPSGAALFEDGRAWGKAPTGPLAGLTYY